jgi:hypothetical protein
MSLEAQRQTQTTARSRPRADQAHRVADEVGVDDLLGAFRVLPRPRDQIKMKAMQQFVERRSEIAQMIRRPVGAEPHS